MIIWKKPGRKLKTFYIGSNGRVGSVVASRSVNCWSMGSIPVFGTDFFSLSLTRIDGYQTITLPTHITHVCWLCIYSRSQRYHVNTSSQALPPSHHGLIGRKGLYYVLSSRLDKKTRKSLSLVYSLILTLQPSAIWYFYPTQPETRQSTQTVEQTTNSKIKLERERERERDTCPWHLCDHSFSSKGLGFLNPKLLPFPCYLAGAWRQRWLQYQNNGDR